MIKNSSSQNGSAFVVIIIVLVVAIIGALGFVFWQNFIQVPDTQVSQQSQEKVPEKITPPKEVERPCAVVGDGVEKNGTFCSESMGLKFKIPKVFEGKLQKEKNYNVYKGPMESKAEEILAGKSLEHYKATIFSGKETLSLSIAKEPLRSGYSSVGHALQSTYFNANNGNLHRVKSPTYDYDDATGKTTITGSWGVGESVPSFKVGDTKVYKGGIGDAGTVEDGYLMVVGGYVVVIKIKHAANPMNEPALDREKPFKDLNSYLKQLKVLE